MKSPMRYPSYRPRRLRQQESFRRLIRETHLSVDQLVMPLFVRPGKNVRAAIASMPGQFQFSVDQLVNECRQIAELRVPAVLLFGLAERKDEKASGAFAKDGLVQQAVSAIKQAVPHLAVITDVCVCAYMSHGHCGIIKSDKRQATSDKRKQKNKKTSSIQLPASHKVNVDNDATLELLSKVALSHTEAGADMVAPSAMMDGEIGAIRLALDRSGFVNLPIMSYAAKYASGFYGPFREAVESGPAFGDRRTYQMDVANAEDAIMEAALDIEEGADIIMVKPALAYLDVIARLKREFPHPVAAFNVSGEYSMVKAASARGWIVERPIWMEMLLGMTRAGADILITYWAKDAAKYLHEQ